MILQNLMKRKKHIILQKLINSLNKSYHFVKMINSLNKTDDFIKMINSLKKTADFIKNDKFS